MTASSGKDAEPRPLIVDQPSPVLSASWSLFGAVLLLLLVASSLFTNSSTQWMITVVLMFSVLGARFLGRTPPPRRHPATVWAMVAVLLSLVLPLFGHTLPSAYSPLLLALAIAWSAVWIVRSPFSIRLAAWGIASLSALAGVLSWKWAGDYLLPGPLLGPLLLIAVAAFFPSLLTFRGTEKIPACLLAILLAVSVVLPGNLAGLATFRLLCSFPSGGDWLLYGPLVLSALLLARTGVKELRRWREPTLLRGLLLGVIPLAVLLPFLFMLNTPEMGTSLFAFYGAVLGVSLASRERLILEDPTRTPRSNPGPWWAPFEEFSIAASSLVAGIVSKQNTNFSEAPQPLRRVLDPSSPRIVNPYKAGRPRWVPVVMHMHSNRWEGAFSARTVVDHYSRLGASSVILTDHNRITRINHPHLGPAAYEHGWGPHNHHVLVLGAEKTVVDKHPFGGDLASRLDTLRRLRAISRFLILAHPRNGDAWDEEDVSSLDYDAVELFNKSSDDTDPFDEALTSGLLVWGTAGDDCHDIRSRHQTGKRYLLLDMRDFSSDADDSPLSERDVLDALEQGRFVAMRLVEPPAERRVTRSLPEPDAPVISSFDVSADSMVVHFAQPVEQATVLSDGGRVIATYKNVASVRLEVPPDLRYARLEVVHGFHTLALNPLAHVREGAVLPWDQA